MKKMLQDATVRYDYMATMHFERSGIGGINKDAWMACTKIQRRNTKTTIQACKYIPRPVEQYV